MIRISYNDNLIKVSGHANFDSKGKDIVCASVSSIIYTTINGLLSLDNDCIKFNDEKDLTIEIIKKTSTVEVLLKSMFDLLKDLEKQYPKNIKISKGE